MPRCATNLGPLRGERGFLESDWNMVLSRGAAKEWATMSVAAPRLDADLITVNPPLAARWAMVFRRSAAARLQNEDCETTEQ